MKKEPIPFRLKYLVNGMGTVQSRVIAAYTTDLAIQKLQAHYSPNSVQVTKIKRVRDNVVTESWQ